MALSVKQLSEFGPYSRRGKAVGSPYLCISGQCWNSAKEY